MKTEVRVLAVIPLWKEFPDFQPIPFDGTVEEFCRRSPEALQEILKKHIGQNVFASCWAGHLRLLTYTVSE